MNDVSEDDCWMSVAELDACYWFVRNEEPHASDKHSGDFQAWLTQSPEHWRLYKEVKQGAADCDPFDI
jgi:ferric-dicitrate binding protein FerR (iron transport regulator)